MTKRSGNLEFHLNCMGDMAQNVQWARTGVLWRGMVALTPSAQVVVMSRSNLIFISERGPCVCFISTDTEAGDVCCFVLPTP